MTTAVARQPRARRKVDEALVKLERLSAKLPQEIEDAAVTNEDINRLIEEDRRARYQERLAARNGRQRRA
ncbi:MAG: hypothetical protein HOP19_13960 [Acidobacteria bacterium]|nr:hypothetical protein [Acidobacteriota bacterium]